MNAAVDAYPLSWPAGWKRTAERDRRGARFNRRNYVTQYKEPLTIADGVERIVKELTMLGADPRSIIISTNTPTRNDGFPRSKAREPDDPGCAVYWTFDGDAECMAADQYTRLADNLAAIAATVEAMRAIQRHGGAQILDRAFSGFKQLSSSSGSTMGEAAAWDTLCRFAGADATQVTIRSVGQAQLLARRAMRATHPDAGGSAGDFQLVQTAIGVLNAAHGWSL